MSEKELLAVRLLATKLYSKCYKYKYEPAAR